MNRRIPGHNDLLDRLSRTFLDLERHGRLPRVLRDDRTCRHAHGREPFTSIEPDEALAPAVNGRGVVRVSRHQPHNVGEVDVQASGPLEHHARERQERSCVNRHRQYGHALVELRCADGDPGARVAASTKICGQLAIEHGRIAPRLLAEMALVDPGVDLARQCLIDPSQRNTTRPNPRSRIDGDRHRLRGIDHGKRNLRSGAQVAIARERLTDDAFFFLYEERIVHGCVPRLIDPSSNGSRQVVSRNADRGSWTSRDVVGQRHAFVALVSTCREACLAVALALIELFQPIAIPLPLGEVEGVVRAQLDRFLQPCFRQQRHSGEHHLGDSNLAAARCVGRPRGQSSATERHVVSEPIRTKILVV